MTSTHKVKKGLYKTDLHKVSKKRYEGIAEVIGYYHAHEGSEQFHSELKTDMDLERLPSGKFETNELVLELAILSYNILRTIGQEALGKRNPQLKWAVKRRRHRTVINNLVNMACHVYYAFEYFAP